MHEKENILVPTFMQIDSLTMSAGKMRTASKTYVVSMPSPIIPQFFLHRFTFSTLHALSHVLPTSFSLSLIELTLESVFVPLNTIEKSIETRSTIFHFEKGFLEPVKKKGRKIAERPIHTGLYTANMNMSICP